MNQNLTDCMSLTDLDKQKMKPGVKKRDFLNWNSCIRHFEVNENKNTMPLTTLTEFFESAMIQQEPFRSAKQLIHKEYEEYGLFFIALCIELQSFLYMCAVIVSGCLCECVFLQPRICQPHHNSQAVSQSLSIVAWMKKTLYRIHYTRRSIINSYLHPL